MKAPSGQGQRAHKVTLASLENKNLSFGGHQEHTVGMKP